MNSITLVAVAIVVVGLALVLAFGASLAAAKPPREEASGVPVLLWCPKVGERTRVGVRSEPSGAGLTVAWCDRFPTGPVACDRACLEPAA